MTLLPSLYANPLHQSFGSRFKLYDDVPVCGAGEQDFERLLSCYLTYADGNGRCLLQS
jgi:hypothetical protein